MSTAREVAAGRWQAGLTRMATSTSVQLLALWDDLGGRSWPDVDTWHAEARPIVSGAAQASLEWTGGYAATLTPAPLSPSTLIVADAAARLYDPLDLIGALIRRGRPNAAASGRSAVDHLGRDAVWRTGRQAIAEMVTGVSQWVRRLDGDACDWCVSLSGVVWPSAHAATFGHDRCGCVPVPLDAIGGHNEAIQSARQIATPKDYSVRQQTTRLRSQIRTATRRQEAARREQATETDPVRRERLSIREQEWETRAERAAERLALLAA